MSAIEKATKIVFFVAIDGLLLVRSVFLFVAGFLARLVLVVAFFLALLLVFFGFFATDLDLADFFFVAALRLAGGETFFLVVFFFCFAAGFRFPIVAVFLDLRAMIFTFLDGRRLYEQPSYI